MKAAVTPTHRSAPHSMARRSGGRTALSSASTAMCTLARYTAAPPRNENNTIMITDAGSGQDSALFMT
jgi:hypothetical protein